MADAGKNDIWSSAESRTYALLGLGAVVLMLLCLLERGMASWAMAPFLIGAAGLMFAWRSAGVFLLLALLIVLHPRAGPRPGLSAQPLADMLLCGATLVYLAALYRLLGLRGKAFPTPPQRKKAAAPPATGTAQIPPRNAEREIGTLLIAAPLCAGLAQICWELLPTSWAPLGLDLQVWRGLTLVWVLGVGVFLSASLLRYLGQSRMTHREALMVLQDVVWQETRREQRRIHRWLTWARLRKRKEPS